MRRSKIVISVFLVVAGAPLGCEQPVSSFEVEPKEVALFNREDSQILKINAFDRDDMEIKEPHVIWQSSDPGIAEVDDSGALSARKSGTATITAMIDNLKRETTVKVDLCEKLEVETPQVSVQPGGVVLPVVNMFNDNGLPSASPVKWSVEDKSIAAVDETGRITGVAVGQTTATVVCGEQSATFKINVALPEASPVEAVPESPTDQSSDAIAPDTPENAAEAESDKIEGDRAVEEAD